MANEGPQERVRAVAKCKYCDSIVPVHVWSDDTIHPIGHSSSGCCKDMSLELIEE